MKDPPVTYLQRSFGAVSGIMAFIAIHSAPLDASPHPPPRKQGGEIEKPPSKPGLLHRSFSFSAPPD